MADDLKLSITLDDGKVVSGFFNIEKQAKNTGKKVEGSFEGALEGLSEVAPNFARSLQNIGPSITKMLSNPLVGVGLVAAGAGLALKQAFDLTLEGEKLIKIEKTFNNLAEQSGIAGENLKTGFIASLGGLIDDSDAIQSLNKALVTLGERATQLPEVMDIARRATNLFGGEVTSNFEAINQAIATGATRQLRGLGIILNAEDAYKKYAESIGVSSSALSEAGKQQAILNAVLEQGGEKFKGVSAESGGATDAYKRFKVSATNAVEDFSVVVATKLAPAFASAFDVATNFFQDFSTLIKGPQKGLDEFTERQKYLTAELEKWQKVVNAGEGDGIIASIFGNGVEEAQKKVNALTNELTAIDQKIENAFLKSKSSSTGTTDSSVDPEIQTKGRKSAEVDFTSFLLQQNQQRLNAAVEYNNALIMQNISGARKLELFNANQKIKEESLAEEQGQAIKAINEKYTSEKFFDVAQKAAAIDAVNLAYEQKRQLLAQQSEEKLLAIRNQATFEQLSGFQSLSGGFDLMVEGMMNAASKFNSTVAEQFTDLGKTIFNSMGSRVGAAFTSFGEALRRGENAGEAFVNVMAQQVAQIASQIGNFFIQAGIARIAASYGADATGYAMIAAGAAINVIGGMLGASVNMSKGASTETGGGIASAPTTATELTPETNLERQEPGTAVSVVIQGDVLDSDESGSRIVALINQAFTQKNVVITQGAFA